MVHIRLINVYRITEPVVNGRVFRSQSGRNALLLAAEALPWTLLGELTAFPDSQGELGRGNGREGRGREKEKYEREAGKEGTKMDKGWVKENRGKEKGGKRGRKGVEEEGRGTVKKGCAPSFSSEIHH